MKAHTDALEDPALADVEAVLQIRPSIGDSPVLLGRTDDPGVVRAVGDRLLEEARAGANLWGAIDPAVSEIKKADAARLSQVFTSLLSEQMAGDGQ